MKTIFKGQQNFATSGFKKSVVAFALGTALSLTSMVYASPNVVPARLKSDAAPVYVVRKGDTLWDISGKFLKQPWRWKEIWAGNRYIKNPNLIYPGDRLLLCTLNGKPLVGKDEGDGCAGIIRRHTGKMQVAQPQVRIEPLNNSISVIPLSDIEKWLYRADILSPESISQTPYVVGAADGRLISASGQKIYARGNGLAVGQKYGIYHATQPYVSIDAKGKKHVEAIELIEVASALSTHLKDDIATLEVSKSYNTEIARGDLVLPEYESGLPSLFFPAEGKIVAGGQVVRVLGSIGDAAKRSVVTLNRGASDGAETGQIFGVYQQGGKVKDTRSNQIIELPDERVGHVMVFKTFDHFSYAYVLDSDLPMKVGSFIRTPEDND